MLTEANGLLYMRARYYSPDMMRFINEDIVTGDISNSNSLNRYSYVEGNPVSMVDPFGLEAERIKSAVKSFICGVGYNLLEDIKPLASLVDGYVNSDFVRLKSPYLQCMPPANNGITIYLFENDLVRIADNQKAFDAGRKTERVADIALMVYGGYKLAGSLCGKLAGFLSSHAIGGFTISGGGTAAATLGTSLAISPEVAGTAIFVGGVAVGASAVGSSSFDLFGKDAQVSVGGLVEEQGFCYTEGGTNSAKGLTGHDFEDYLTNNFGGNGSFSVGGRDFDGGIGNRWWEAKSGQYWDMLENNPNMLAKFKSDMGDRLRIATQNNASYEIFSNSPIPDSIKTWLTKKGIPFTEILD